MEDSSIIGVLKRQAAFIVLENEGGWLKVDFWGKVENINKLKKK